jgi:hypothetical protein
VPQITIQRESTTFEIIPEKKPKKETEKPQLFAESCTSLELNSE